MANAFATFAADGTYCTPISITEVDDSHGQKTGGQTQNCQADALKPGVAQAATNVLQDVGTKGSGLLIPEKLGVPDAMKTGTNQYNNQTWVVGYTKGLATASFFGDPFNSTARIGRNLTVNGQFYPVVDGAYIAGPQWARYMQQALGYYDHGNFDAPPQNLITATPTQSHPASGASTNGSSPPPSAAPAAPPAPAGKGRGR
jgi:membrane peptidoglycan carboxypeptidase